MCRFDSHVWRAQPWPWASAVTEVGTGTVAEPWAQTRNETDGENLQNDVVLMMRPRGRLQAFRRFTLDPVETYYYPSFF